MGRHIRENTLNPVPGSGILPRLNSRGVLLYIIVFIALLVLVPLVQAREPDWNYSTSDVDIGSVAISPAGGLIAVGAERVLFFSRDGPLLGEEPYGTSVLMTADGKYTASVYFATLYFFKNPQPGGPAEQQKATKVWERELSEQVYSIDMSRDGSLIVGQTTGRKIFIINTITMAVEGNDYKIDHVVKVSPDGRRIVGISQSEVHSYTLTGLLTHTAALTTFSAPHTALLPLNGTFAIFNDGQTIRCVNSYNGTELWKGQVTGYVTSLSMTPAASAIIAGTETGNIAALNSKGNLSWTYAANPEHRQASGITCTALSDNGAVITAGTADGRILFLNARGELTDSWTGKEYIRHIAVSADGSTIVATSDYTIWAFTSGTSSRPQTVTTTSPSSTTTAVPSVLTTVGTPVPESTLSPDGTTPATITEIPTTYSVIRTATQSPPSLITLAGSLMLALFVLAGKR